MHFTSFTLVITSTRSFPLVRVPFVSVFRFLKGQPNDLFPSNILSLSLLITRSRGERKRLTYTHPHTRTLKGKDRRKQCRRRRLVNTSIDEAKSKYPLPGKKIIPRRTRKTTPTTPLTPSSKPPARLQTMATNRISRSIPIPPPIRTRTKKSSTTT